MEQDIILGIDVDYLQWTDFALCKGFDTNDFFDNYEESDNYARVVDEVCLSCPVMKQCLQFGTENKEQGVWGGVYLIAGKPDKTRNAHKTPAIWQQIERRIVDTTD